LSVRKVGRPLKYLEPTTAKSISLPTSYLEQLNMEADEVKVSTSELIYNKLLASDPETTRELIGSFNEMRDVVKAQLDQLESQTKVFEYYKSRLDKKTLGFVIEEIEENPELQAVVSKHVEDYKPNFRNLVRSNNLAFALQKAMPIVYGRVEASFLAKNQRIKKPAIIQALIKRNLVK